MNAPHKSATSNEPTSGAQPNPKQRASAAQCFVAIDLERANGELGSVVELGLVRYENSELTQRYSSTLKYTGTFDYYATKVHGLRKSDVRNSPAQAEGYAAALELSRDCPLFLHHGGVEPACLRVMATNANLPMLAGKWVDTVKLAKVVWPEYKKGGASLANLAQRLGLTFENHRALDDAWVCAQAFLAMQKDKPDLVANYLKGVSASTALAMASR